MWVWTLLSLAIALTIWFTPVQVNLQIHQQGFQASLAVNIRVVLLSISRNVSITDKVEMALEHMLKRWMATGEPVKIPLQKTIRRMPRQLILCVLRPPVRYLCRHMRCTRLMIATEVGGRDAMESALLSGGAWAVVGTGLAYMSRRVRLDPSVPKVQVVPNFSGPALRLESDCILRFRLGHAIVAGIWLIFRGLREKELRLWVRDSLRRKGVEGSGRTSDPRADEDGHGEP